MVLWHALQINAVKVTHIPLLSEVIHEHKTWIKNLTQHT